MGEEWIVATCTRRNVTTGTVDVWDEEEEDPTRARYTLPFCNVIALPRAATPRDGPNYNAAEIVLAVYPGTTTFYRACVIKRAMKLADGTYGAYTLEFDDDGDGTEPPPARFVPFCHVVRMGCCHK